MEERCLLPAISVDLCFSELRCIAVQTQLLIKKKPLPIVQTTFGIFPKRKTEKCNFLGKLRKKFNFSPQSRLELISLIHF